MKLRVALAQINPTVGDLAGNRELLIRFLKESQTHRADLVVFPELALTGYPPEDLLFKEQFVKDNLLALRGLLPHTKGLACVVGFVDFRSGKRYNAAALLSNGRWVATYYKNHLPNYGVFDERRYFEPGESCLVYSEGDLRVGLSICEDLWVEKGPSFIEGWEGGAGLLVNISASPYEAGKLHLRKRLLSRRAKEASAYLLYNNMVGGQDELIFDGGGMIFDAKGKLITEAPQFEEFLLVHDLEIPPSKKKGKKSRRIFSVRLTGKDKEEKPPLPARESRIPFSEEEEIYKALVLGTKDYVRKNRFEKVVLGLSGGVDSALVACVAVDALGKEGVVGVGMPSGYSSDETKRDAKDLARHLGIRFIELPIDHLFRSCLGLLSALFRGHEEGVAEENLQARIRGILLMALSNKFGWLVLTTGNKSEMSVGYCTLYGDMAGGFAVIKDLPKTWVYRLASFRNRSGAVIPESVLTREPTAELKPNQKDSDSLPAYAKLDPILEAYIEKSVILSEKEAGLPPERVREVIEKIDRNEYKRRQGPPGIKITPRAFGKDWRFPITNRYREGEQGPLP